MMSLAALKWAVVPILFLPVWANFAAPKCDFQVKTSANGTLLYICENGPCTNCTITGSCVGQATLPDANDIEIHYCLCYTAGPPANQSGDDCTTVITFNVKTGVTTIACFNTCCPAPTGANCVNPPVGKVYPAWIDPCGC